MSNAENNHFHQVLIVDDEHLEAELLSVFLCQIGSYATTMAASIQELWECLSDGAYDIILLDYRLPDGTGLEALTEMPQRGIHTPVIMLTGQGDERIAALSIQKGARDYLVKGTDILASLPTRIQKAIHDHSLEVSAERALEQIRYQALLLNNVRDAVVVWNMEGNITFWNPAAERLFGLRAEEMQNHAVEDKYLKRFTPPIRTPAPEYTTGQQIERQFTTARDETIWVSSQVSALRDYTARGKVIGYMDVCREITKSKKMEAQLIQSTRMASFGELASGVAHQINNPLTTIIAEAQMLLRDLPPEHPSRDFVDAIEQAGWRTQKIVQQLIEFSQPAPNTSEPLDINQTIGSALNLVSEAIRSTGIVLETHLHPELPAIVGNARRIEELWVNLLLLARRKNLSEQACTIRILSHPGPRETVVVEVSDACHSISTEQLRNFFEPNLTSPVTGQGTGIELSICREIVRQHQGQITVENDPVDGIVIRIIFPVMTISSQNF